MHIPSKTSDMQIHTNLFHIRIAGIKKIRTVKRRMAGLEKDTEMPSMGRLWL